MTMPCHWVRFPFVQPQEYDVGPGPGPGHLPFVVHSGYHKLAFAFEFALNLIYRWRRGSWIVDRGRAEQWHMRRCIGEPSLPAERLYDPWPSTWLLGLWICQ